MLETLAAIGSLMSGAGNLASGLFSIFGGGGGFGSDTEDQIRRSIRWANQWAAEDRERMKRLIWPWQEEVIDVERELSRLGGEFEKGLFRRAAMGPQAMADEFAAREAALTLPTIRRAYQAQESALDRELAERGVTRSGAADLARASLLSSKARAVSGAINRPRAAYLRIMPEYELQLANLTRGKGPAMPYGATGSLTTAASAGLGLLRNQQAQLSGTMYGLGQIGRALWEWGKPHLSGLSVWGQSPSQAQGSGFSPNFQAMNTSWPGLGGLTVKPEYLYM